MGSITGWVIGVGGLVTSVPSLATYGRAHWAQATRRLLGRLEATRLPPTVMRLGAHALEGLPTPVQRHFWGGAQGRVTHDHRGAGGTHRQLQHVALQRTMEAVHVAAAAHHTKPGLRLKRQHEHRAGLGGARTRRLCRRHGHAPRKDAGPVPDRRHSRHRQIRQERVDAFLGRGGLGTRRRC